MQPDHVGRMGQSLGDKDLSFKGGNVDVCCEP